MTSSSSKIITLSIFLFVTSSSSARAEPVTGWATPNGDAGYSGGSELTNSPITTSADDDTIAGNFTEVTLGNGDILELTGSVAFDVALVGNQFRFGLFDGDVPVVTGQGSGYVGYWVNTPSANGQTSEIRSANGSTTNPFSGGASMALANFTGSVVNPPANTTMDYLLRITRIGNTADLFASFTDGAGYDISWLVNGTPASPASFTYNSVAFLMGGTLDGNVGTFSNVDVSLSQLQTITLEVNTTTGSARLVNNSGPDFDINSYEILSAAGSLNLGGWNSLDSQNIDAVDGPDLGPDAGDSIGEGWDAAPSSNQFVLSEVFLTGSTLLQQGQSLNLGNIFSTGMTQDLEFNFTEVGGTSLVAGLVSYVTGGALSGDFNGDGMVDAADYTVYRDNLGASDESAFAAGTGNGGGIDSSDYALWRANFGSGSSSGAIASASGVIPEPATTMLVAVGLVTLVGFRKWHA